MKFNWKHTILSLLIFISGTVKSQEINDKIQSIRKMDSLFSSITSYYNHNEFEFDNEENFVYITIPNAIVIDSLYLANNDRYHSRSKTIRFHKDSIDTFNFDSIGKLYKINISAIRNLSRLMIEHKVKIIYTISPGDCQGCALLIVFQNQEYYVIEHIWDHCYPDWCFYHKKEKAKTKRLTEDIQLIENGEALYKNN